MRMHVQTELTRTELAQLKITPAELQMHAPPNSPIVRALARFFTLAFTRPSTLVAGRLKVGWRSVVLRAANKRKTLSVRETAALGDRRFISVVQFERQRFLIGSSPASINLISKLPDESAGAEPIAKRSEKQEKRGEGN